VSQQKIDWSQPLELSNTGKSVEMVKGVWKLVNAISVLDYAVVTWVGDNGDVESDVYYAGRDQWLRNVPRKPVDVWVKSLDERNMHALSLMPINGWKHLREVIE
jgi:hypothetical protein